MVTKYAQYISYRRLKMYMLLLGVFFLAVIPTIMQAQSRDATLRVVALSQKDGTFVTGANILLTAPRGDTLYTGVSDRNGFHEFSAITPRTYQIHISFVGYKTYTDTLTLKQGEIRIYKAELKQSTLQLQELVVGGNRLKPRVAGKQTISTVDIARVPTPGPVGDLTTYLQTLPGVVTTGSRGGELYVRGGTPTQNMVLVDNMPIIKPFHISNLFSAFPKNIINTVDFYAGGFGARYTGATSSVLDVNLRQGNMKHFNGRASGSPHVVSFTAEGPMAKDVSSFLISGRSSIIKQTAPSIINQDVPLRFYDLTARLSFKWSGFTCSMTGIHTFDKGEINPLRNIDLGWTNTAIGSHCLGYIPELKNTFEITAGFTNFNGSESGFDNTTRESGVTKYYVKVDNNAALFGIPTDYGFGLSFDSYNAHLEDEFAGGNQSGVRFKGLDSSLEKLQGIFTGYLSLNWQPSDYITVNPGVATQTRLNILAATLEPRFRISWRPDGSDQEEFSLAAGRYFQVHEALTDNGDAGTVFHVYKPVDEHDPLPEALQGIVGYSRKFSSRIDANIEGYIKKQTNTPVAEFSLRPTTSIQTVRADGFTYGADARLELDLYPFYVSLGYSWSKVTYEAPAGDLTSLFGEKVKYNPSQDRRNQLNIISSYNISGFTISASWQYSSGNPFTRLFGYDFALSGLPDQNPLTDRGSPRAIYSKPFNGRLPSLQRLDVSVERSFDLSPGFSLKTKVGAINAYDSQNVFYFDVYTLQQLNDTPFFPYLSLSAIIK